MSDKVTLTNDQFGELVQQFVELQVDNMDTQTMAEWITDELIYQYGRLTNSELQERVDCYNEGLFDELVDNVTNEIAQPKVTITPQQLEGDISTVTDDDYADKVDILVGNMVASDDNVFTHDSEGC